MVTKGAGPCVRSRGTGGDGVGDAAGFLEEPAADTAAGKPVWRPAAGSQGKARGIRRDRGVRTASRLMGLWFRLFILKKGKGLYGYG